MLINEGVLKPDWVSFINFSSFCNSLCKSIFSCAIIYLNSNVLGSDLSQSCFIPLDLIHIIWWKKWLRIRSIATRRISPLGILKKLFPCNEIILHFLFNLLNHFLRVCYHSDKTFIRHDKFSQYFTPISVSIFQNGQYKKAFRKLCNLEHTKLMDRNPPLDWTQFELKKLHAGFFVVSKFALVWNPF